MSPSAANPSVAYVAARLLLLKKYRLSKRSRSLPSRSSSRLSRALVLFHEAPFGELRLAPRYLGLFLEEPPLFFELASSEHGRPDGAYAGGDAAYRYDQG